MSASLRWTADGIEAAERAGGITLETYRRPGFAGGTGVRRRPGGGDAIGFGLEPTVEDEDDDLDAAEHRR